MSKLTADPSRGLASVEALYLAKLMLGERDDSILAEYYWAENFMHNLKVAGLVG